MPALLMTAFLAVPAAARASLADEQRQGQDLIAQLQAGSKTCGDLPADDFDHIGEYAMCRALGDERAPGDERPDDRDDGRAGRVAHAPAPRPALQRLLHRRCMTAACVTGALAGGRLAGRLAQRQLATGFATLVALVATYLLISAAFLGGPPGAS